MYMIVNNVSLTHTAVRPPQFPTNGLPEIAFAGKSNVGKSSLINNMLGRKSLARTSGQPGKTRTINFYEVEKKLYFVDLPGYGYARVSKAEKATWGKMVESYLKGRASLKNVIMLVDIRHDPGENDLMLFDWLSHYDFPVTVVATKSDKLGKNQAAKQLARIRDLLSLNYAPLPFSKKSPRERDILWARIMEDI